jgi:hypothetical protein
MKRILCLWSLAVCAATLCACATTQARRELEQRPAAGTARVAVVELGWDSFEDQNPLHPPVVDQNHPRRYRGVVMDEAHDLAARCNDGGTPFAELSRKSSSQSPMEMVTVEPQSKEPYRDTALRLRPGECASVDGPSSEYVVKRLE